jgi:hypothetical protein
MIGSVEKWEELLLPVTFYGVIVSNNNTIASDMRENNPFSIFKINLLIYYLHLGFAVISSNVYIFSALDPPPPRGEKYFPRYTLPP